MHSVRRGRGSHRRCCDLDRCGDPADIRLGAPRRGDVGACMGGCPPRTGDDALAMTWIGSTWRGSTRVDSTRLDSSPWLHRGLPRAGKDAATGGSSQPTVDGLVMEGDGRTWGEGEG